MTTVYLDNDPVARDLARVAFPAYSGRRYKLRVVDPATPMNITSYWDGGSRSYYAFVNLATKAVVTVPQNGSGFDRPIGPTPIPEGCALIEHSIFQGHDVGITIHLRTENATAMLPKPVELTRDEKIVLIATRSLKSSYGGVRDYRFHEASRETGITAERWNVAKDALIGRGLLNRAGAITDTGRNAVGSGSLWEMRP